MSESTRALCQIIEARPLLTLTDEELKLLHRATANMATLVGKGGASIRRWTALADKIHDEMETRVVGAALVEGFTRGRNYPTAGRPGLTDKGLAALRESEEQS